MLLDLLHLSNEYIEREKKSTLREYSIYESAPSRDCGISRVCPDSTRKIMWWRRKKDIITVLITAFYSKIRSIFLKDLKSSVDSVHEVGPYSRAEN